MSKLTRFYQSTIGKKVVVALTGLALLLFLFAHMAGNLKAFAGVGSDGAAKLDHYAYFLRTVGSDIVGYQGIIWATRVGLLVCLTLHIVTVIQLALLNKAARPVDYVKYAPRKATVPALSMLYSGGLVFVFIVYHILHFTIGSAHTAGFVHGHVYANVYSAFQNPAVVCIYVAAMLLIGMHLYHGIWSLFQTLGLDSPDRNPSLILLSKAISLLLVLGFLSVPVAIFAGLLPEPPQVFIASLEG